MTNSKISRRRFLSLAAGLTVPSVFIQSASAQNYPARTVRIIVPLTAGSAADILARYLAPRLSESWGQPISVENRPGAGTTLGTDEVAKAPPDGHTLLVNSASFAASAAMYSMLPYDPLKDFAPISQIAFAPFVVVASPSLGARSIKDLVELAKTKPGQISFGSSGAGTSSHFGAAQLNLAAGITVVHVPFKGPPDALAETMAGRVQFFLSPLPPALPFIKEGRLLALGVTTAQRSSALPEVPTVAQAGLAGYEYQDWWGAFAPAATAPAVVDKISQAVSSVLALPEVTNQLLARGVEARSSKPEEFAKFVRAKIDAARQVAKATGIRAN
jgi:tripartite-type tricarboxylate transporter receptor subunit TctC